MKVRVWCTRFSVFAFNLEKVQEKLVKLDEMKCTCNFQCSKAAVTVLCLYNFLSTYEVRNLRIYKSEEPRRLSDLENFNTDLLSQEGALVSATAERSGGRVRVII